MGQWPEGIRCVVMLTFDVDGVSSWLRRNPDFSRLPTLMSMAEYGPAVATPRILDLLDSYGIRATFFIPGYVAETHRPLVQEVVRRGHEVGHHGYMHEPPATLSPQEEVEVLERGIRILAEITGQAPVGYRAPSWELSPRTLGLLAERGFLYDSSLMGDDTPYRLEVAGRGLVEIPVHWSLDDFPYWAYVPAVGRVAPPASPEQVYGVWSEAFLETYERGGAFCLTMHPQHTGRPGRLRMLERLVRLMRSRAGVAFMPCREVARLVAGQAGAGPLR